MAYTVPVPCCIGDLNPTGLTIVVVIGVYIVNVPPRFYAPLSVSSYPSRLTSVT